MSTESHRPVVVGSHGMVSAGDSLAAAEALRILQTGGTAVDAAIAASAVQSVVELPWCGLGGDAFMLVSTPESGVVAFNGSGPAPRAIHAGLLEGPRAPRHGPLSVGVPGLVATWDALTRWFPTQPLNALLQTAITYARDGFPVYPRLARALAKPSAAFLVDHGVRTGHRIRQASLANTLEAIAAGGASAFYAGPAGNAIVEYLTSKGGVLSREDLTAVRVTPEPPIGITYRGRQVVSNPPVSLGCILLHELNILEHFDLSAFDPASAELVDLLVACKQAAFADAADLGDPADTDNHLDWLLSAERANYWGQRIDRHTLEEEVAITAGGSDTTSTVVGDAHGNTVTLIQSLFNEFGSREVVPECGVLLNDRLANLSLDPARSNGLRGGRRPLHTLNTYMVLEAGRPVLAGATPGGRGQVQTNLQVLVNVLDFGMDVQTAVDQPRWISGLPYRGENDRTLYLEPTFTPEVIEGLQGLGHAVQVGVDEGEQADPFGNCTVIARSAVDQTLQGAADTRRDAFAIGY